MWLKGNSSLVNALHGPSQVKTQINGKWVTVQSATQYPFGYTFVYTVTAEQNNFQLRIRKPEGIRKFTVNERYTEEDGFIVIGKTWQGTQEVNITFYPDILQQEDVNHETYFTYGGMVLALPVAYSEAKTKAYPVQGFYDLSHTPQRLVVYEYAGEPITQVDGTLSFKTVLFNPISQQKETVMLVPMAQTILRQVTFRRAKKE